VSVEISERLDPVASSSLKNTGIRFAALLTTFVAGIATYSIMQQTAVTVADIPTAAAKREDDLHRLYEAAMLSGDSGLRDAIVLRLTCAGAEDSLEIQFVQAHPSSECEKANNNLEPEISRLRKSHEPWTRRNMDFIREISTAEKARAYAIAHLH
jgi:hypothetical protein